MARGVLSHLTNLTQSFVCVCVCGGGGGGGGVERIFRERKGKREKGRYFREKGSTFSLKFSGDRTVGSR